MRWSSEHLLKVTKRKSAEPDPEPFSRLHLGEKGGQEPSEGLAAVIRWGPASTAPEGKRRRATAGRLPTQARKADRCPRGVLSRQTEVSSQAGLGWVISWGNAREVSSATLRTVSSQSARGQIFITFDFLFQENELLGQWEKWMLILP